jgi:hypothetical protein
MWAASPSDVRKQCDTEATTRGSQSYVDLLICLQAAYIATHPNSAAVAARYGPPIMLLPVRLAGI